jgi:hypothetical protein
MTLFDIYPPMALASAVFAFWVLAINRRLKHEKSPSDIDPLAFALTIALGGVSFGFLLYQGKAPVEGFFPLFFTGLVSLCMGALLVFAIIQIIARFRRSR